MYPDWVSYISSQFYDCRCHNFRRWRQSFVLRVLRIIKEPHNCAVDSQLTKTRLLAVNDICPRCSEYIFSIHTTKSNFLSVDVAVDVAVVVVVVVVAAVMISITMMASLIPIHVLCFLWISPTNWYDHNLAGKRLLSWNHAWWNCFTASKSALYI